MLCCIICCTKNYVVMPRCGDSRCCATAARDQLETEEITSVSTQAERDALSAAVEQADEWLLTEVFTCSFCDCIS